MAVDLSLTYSQSNDNKTLTFTDATGVYDAVTNTGGWGTPNTAVTDIDGTAGTLSLTITVVTPDGETTYDAIDLFTVFGDGGFSTVNDLVFAINASHLESSGTALGTSDTELPDGIYEVSYTYTDVSGNDPGSTDTYTEDTLVDGQVRNSVYELLRVVPVIYACNECRCEEMYEAQFSYSYLKAMEYSAFVAKKEELIDQLETLQGIVLNGSKCTWYSD